jgi:hypothetical protein
MALSTRNGLWLFQTPYAAAPAPASPSALPPLRTDGMLEAVASGHVRLASLQSNVVIQSGAVSVVTVTPTQVIVNADLLVNGSIDSVYSSELVVRDKAVVLASLSNLGGSNSGSSNSSAALSDGAGVRIDGAPERSVLWNRGLYDVVDPAAADGTSTCQPGGTSNAGAWTVRGGSLRLAARCVADGDEVAYGFAINAAKELEVYATLSNASGTTRRRVACLGPPRWPSASGGAAGGALALPVSPVPW